MVHNCRKCGIVLDSENWRPSYRKRGYRACKECADERIRVWRNANPEMVNAQQIRKRRKQGMRPFGENKECPMFLGVHVAERVLSHAFKDVNVMPLNNQGYDFICNKGMKIDVKSSCLHRNRNTQYWNFHIRHNTTADFFLCLAFDNREDLNPLHAWLIPGSKLNNLSIASIRQSTTQHVAM